MSKELTKNLFCIVIRGNIQVWVEEEKALVLKNELSTNSERKFVNFEDKTFNVVDIVGIFSARDMEEKRRRDNGEWKCKFDNWHDKFEKCDVECALKN